MGMVNHEHHGGSLLGNSVPDIQSIQYMHCLLQSSSKYARGLEERNLTNQKRFLVKANNANMVTIEQLNI